jgi:methylthioribose-1-phosphate isomerase
MHSKAVWMIDQRLLPGEFQIVTYDDAGQIAAAIRDMVVRGAPAIGATAGFGLALAAHRSSAQTIQVLRSDLQQAANVLHAARPTAVNLAWALQRVLAAFDAAVEAGAALGELRGLVLSAAQRWDEDVEINMHGAA